MQAWWHSVARLHLHASDGFETVVICCSRYRLGLAPHEYCFCLLSAALGDRGNGLRAAAAQWQAVIDDSRLLQI
jgi:hypothetical protein